MKKFLKRYIALMSFSNFILGFVAPIMYVVLKSKGFEVLEIAILIIFSSITTIFFEVPCGILSDKIGRKLLFMLGQCCFLIFSLFMYFSATFELMAVAMAFAGLSAAMVSGTLDALLVEELNRHDATPEEVQQSLAKVGLYSMLGMLVGALVSGALFKLNVYPDDYSSYERNYGLVALLLPLQILLCALLIKEKAVEKNETQRQGLIKLFSQAFKYFTKNNTLLALMMSSAMGAMAFISFEKFWQLQLIELLDDEGMKWLFGVLFASSLVAGAIGQILSHRFCKLFSNNYVYAIIVVRVLHAALFIALYLTTITSIFITVFLLIFFVSSLSFSPVMTLFHNRVEDCNRSTMLSFRSVFIQLGAALGIVLAALVSEYVDLPTAFLASGVIYLLSITIMLIPSIISLGTELSTPKEASR